MLATSPFGCGGLALLPVRSLTKRVNRSSTSAVQAFRRTVGSGRPQFLGAATATTNDRGEYRLAASFQAVSSCWCRRGRWSWRTPWRREVQAGRLQSRRDLAAALVTGSQGDSGRGFVDRPRWIAAASATKRRAAVLSADLPSIRADDRPDRAADDHARARTRRDRPAAATSANAARLEDSSWVPTALRRACQFGLWPRALDDFALDQDATTTTADANGAFSFSGGAIRALLAACEQRSGSSGRKRLASTERPLGRRSARRRQEDVDGVVLTLNDALRIRGHIELENARHDCVVRSFGARSDARAVGRRISCPSPTAPPSDRPTATSRSAQPLAGEILRASRRITGRLDVEDGDD